MFETSAMLYIYVETPLHAGSGSSVGVVDLPIQRERVTGYPVVQASGLKGKLRSEARSKAGEKQDEMRRVQIVFGSEQHDFAGALSPGDARTLLFPVRSLAGVFAWTTSRGVLARLKRDLQAADKGREADWNLPEDDEGALITDDGVVVVADRVVLEEFAFDARPHAEVARIAQWLALHAFPQTEEYAYYRQKVLTSLVVLPENAFRDFTQLSTEVVARIKINQETKTVAGGALWTEEHLPSDTLLYSPLHATRPRSGTDLFDGDDGKSAAERILDYVRGLGLDRIQLGGDETVGRGIVRLHLA